MKISKRGRLRNYFSLLTVMFEYVDHRDVGNMYVNRDPSVKKENKELEEFLTL